jgi:V/A-type H+-transporting ATPase subunit K
MKRKAFLLALAAVLFAMIAATTLPAQEAARPQAAAQAAAPAVRPARGDLAIGLIALGAALAVGITALGTGIAQSRIGAAGAGTIAEKPESIGAVILLIAIPETMVILGFVIAIIMMFIL